MQRNPILPYIKRKTKRSWAMVQRSVLEQILRKYKTLCNNGLLHMDLNPNNILVDNSHRAYFIDFGKLAVPATHFNVTETLKWYGEEFHYVPSDYWTCMCPPDKVDKRNELKALNAVAIQEWFQVEYWLREYAHFLLVFDDTQSSSAVDKGNPNLYSLYVSTQIDNILVNDTSSTDSELEQGPSKRSRKTLHENKQESKNWRAMPLSKTKLAEFVFVRDVLALDKAIQETYESLKRNNSEDKFVLKPMVPMRFGAEDMPRAWWTTSQFLEHFNHVTQDKSTRPVWTGSTKLAELSDSDMKQYIQTLETDTPLQISPMELHVPNSALLLTTESMQWKVRRERAVWRTFKRTRKRNNTTSVSVQTMIRELFEQKV
jgi:serine/threonine protein kinase